MKAEWMEVMVTGHWWMETEMELEMPWRWREEAGDMDSTLQNSPPLDPRPRLPLAGTIAFTMTNSSIHLLHSMHHRIVVSSATTTVWLSVECLSSAVLLAQSAPAASDTLCMPYQSPPHAD